MISMEDNVVDDDNCCGGDGGDINSNDDAVDRNNKNFNMLAN